MRLQEFVYRAALHQPAHTHDAPSISMIVEGSVAETAGRSEWNGGAGCIIVKPRDVVHDDHYGDSGARMFSLTLPADHEVGSYRWIFGGPAAALFTRAVGEWRAGAVFDELATDLVAATYGGELKSGRSGTWAEIARRVAETDVSVAALSEELAMHPVALARAFRRHFGCSLTAWRRRARIRHAIELLSGTRMPLTGVALESGFADQSHLCRIFRREIGVTPAYFRTVTV